MKHNIHIYGISVSVGFVRNEIDDICPITGHYTVPGTWELETLEHQGENILPLISDTIIRELENTQNAMHP